MVLDLVCFGGLSLVWVGLGLCSGWFCGFGCLGFCVCRVALFCVWVLVLGCLCMLFMVWVGMYVVFLYMVFNGITVCCGLLVVWFEVVLCY